jgi:hypothetical protein
MGAKAELERELIFCKARVEALEEQLRGALAEKQGLFQQVEKLTDSLISIRAPEAYRDIQIEKEGPQPMMSAETMEKNRITKEFTTNYFNAIEGPTFRDGNDLDDLLTEGIIRNTDHTPPSVHGNNES